ncbi:MAG: nucleotidyltransferase domain-containing protein [Deltaproteobacteria bacterium]|nr:nucleotidyltransferase domain-containing protein [Deltaproteobacteria bacterium]
MRVSLSLEDRKRLTSLGVGIVYLFGSHAEGMEGPLSDIDVGVVVTDPRRLSVGTNELYLSLFGLLSQAVDNSDRLDIVFLQRAPLELRFDVVAHGQPVFEVSSDFRLDFEERTTLAYCDYRPILREFDRALLEPS